MHELFVMLDHTVTALALSLRQAPHRREGSEQNSDWEIIDNLVDTIGLLLDSLDRHGNAMNDTPSTSTSLDPLFPGILSQAGHTSHRANEGLIERDPLTHTNPAQ